MIYFSVIFLFLIFDETRLSFMYVYLKGRSICILFCVFQMEAPTQLLAKSSDVGHSTDGLPSVVERGGE